MGESLWSSLCVEVTWVGPWSLLYKGRVGVQRLSMNGCNRGKIPSMVTEMLWQRATWGKPRYHVEHDKSWKTFLRLLSIHSRLTWGGFGRVCGYNQRKRIKKSTLTVLKFWLILVLFQVYLTFLLLLHNFQKLCLAKQNSVEIPTSREDEAVTSFQMPG